MVRTLKTESASTKSKALILFGNFRVDALSFGNVMRTPIIVGGLLASPHERATVETSHKNKVTDCIYQTVQFVHVRVAVEANARRTISPHVRDYVYVKE